LERTDAQFASQNRIVTLREVLRSMDSAKRQPTMIPEALDSSYAPILVSKDRDEASERGNAIVAGERTEAEAKAAAPRVILETHGSHQKLPRACAAERVSSAAPGGLGSL
jgi:hypothetical protein